MASQEGSSATRAEAGCQRCGHQMHQSPSSGERLRRVVGMKPRRTTCRSTTELGQCPCRSRFHMS